MDGKRCRENALFNNTVQLGNIREQALELVRNAEIRHKPDRHGGGALFQEFAYGTTSIDGDTRTYLSRRKKLTSLAGKKYSADKLRKLISTIVSREVQRHVSTAFEARLLNGKTPFEALQEPIEYPTYRNHIKTVMCATGLAESSSRIVHQSRTGSHTKILVDDGWACLTVSTSDGKNIETRLLSPRIAASKRALAPHNGETIFFKGDTVIDTTTKKTYLIRQIRAQAGGLLVMTPAVDAREVRDMSAVEGLKTISGKGLLKIRHT